MSNASPMDSRAASTFSPGRDDDQLLHEASQRLPQRGRLRGGDDPFRAPRDGVDRGRHERAREDADTMTRSGRIRAAARRPLRRAAASR